MRGQGEGDDGLAARELLKRTPRITGSIASKTSPLCFDEAHLDVELVETRPAAGRRGGSSSRKHGAI